MAATASGRISSLKPAASVLDIIESSTCPPSSALRASAPEPNDGGWRFAFVAQGKHRNRRDVVHGGMLMAFADRAMGLTARRANHDQPQTTIQLGFQFIDAVQVGDLVEARCEVVRRTRFIIFMSATLTVGGEPVGTATGI